MQGSGLCIGAQQGRKSLEDTVKAGAKQGGELNEKRNSVMLLGNRRKKCCKLRKMWYTIHNRIKGQGVRANSPQAEWGAKPRESVTVMPLGADSGG